MNSLRPELPQKSAIDGFEGEVIVVTCDDYIGERRTERNFKNDLPVQELKMRLTKLSDCLKKKAHDDENLKILMITHKVLATQQGYEKLLSIIEDGLRDKEDPFLLFFMQVVEPVYTALCTSDMQLLFNTLGIKRYPITRKEEKARWTALKDALSKVRGEKAISVLKTVVDSKLIPIPPKIERYYQLYYRTPELRYTSNTAIKEFLELEYEQFLAAINFLYPDAEFSTEHSVKGEEYDNVIFVIGKGWNQYQFEVYAPMINNTISIPLGKENSFERNRNLFYVCCSRPRKRLVLFITIPLESPFKEFLIKLIGKDNIYTYKEFLSN